MKSFLLFGIVLIILVIGSLWLALFLADKGIWFKIIGFVIIFTSYFGVLIWHYKIWGEKDDMTLMDYRGYRK